MLRHFSNTLVRAWKDYISPRVLPLLSTIEVVGLALAALSLWGFAQIADEVLDQETQAFDTAILQGIAQFHSPLFDNIAIAVTFFGEPNLLVLVGAIVGSVLLWKRRRSEAVVFAIAAGGATALNFWLKTVFGRARPELWERIVDANFNSFPSGHAMISLVVWGAIAYGLALDFPPWRKFISSVATILIGAIGFSRLYLGVHWPTDIIAGYTAGLVWLIACILTLEGAQRYLGEKRSSVISK
ncbi:MAG: phosphatase PAP2 family protein [Cyanobacteriota bacterium]|nr:phosphatase PAP2 family protein [Cyanobacteriota bacterium]